MLDETITYWITGGTLAETIERAWSFQGQSPLYFIIVWIVRTLGYESEQHLRLISMAAMFATIGPLLYIARIFNIPYAIGLLPLALFSEDTVVRYCLMARPYPFALFSLVSSTALLLDWMSTGRKLSFVLYPIFLTLTLYFQYIFAPVIGLHLLLFTALRNNLNKVQFRWLIWTWFISALMLIPGILHIVSWLSRSNLLVQVPLPSYNNLAFRFFPLGALGLPLLGCLIAALNIPFKTRKGDSKTVAILAVWAFLPPILNYLLSLFFASNFFIDRYYLWRAPGLALLVGYLLNLIDSQKFIKVTLIGWMCFSATVELLRNYHMDDWLVVQQFINENTSEELLLLNTGLLELDTPPYAQDSVSTSYLTAPFSVYPINNPTIIIPPTFEGEREENYLKTTILPQINKHQSFIIVAARSRRFPYNGKNLLSIDYYQEILSLLNFKEETRISLGTVDIAKYVGNKITNNK
jgi:hypothetical protein